jgi:DNA-binding GntR family transcriptional regulator
MNRMSQMQQVEQNLRDMILGLELGPGERLTERWIEARFEASRTPVRAALLRLESEGLVCRDGRGWIVAPIDVDELGQLFVYREVIEVAAVRLTCRLEDRSGVDVIEAMLQSCGPDTSREEWHRVGMEFHTELARLSGNEFFARGIRSVMTLLARPRWLEVRNEPARDLAWAEHVTIVNLVRAGDTDRAADRLAAHVRSSRDRLLASLQDDRRSLRARGFKVVAG